MGFLVKSVFRDYTLRIMAGEYQIPKFLIGS